MSNFLKNLQNKAGEVVSPTALEGKTVGLYFSAHWCPPCRQFTPTLKEFYEEINEEEKKFEVVFVTSDETAENQQKYMDEMHGDWLRIPFNDPQIAELKRQYGVCAGAEVEGLQPIQRECGIPALTIIEQDGKMIVRDGRGDVEKGQFDMRNWKK